MPYQAGIINYAVYENGNEYLGIANVKLPDRTNKKLTLNGAGIPGDVDLPVPGHLDAMTVNFTFLDAPKDAYKLTEQRVHLVTIMAAHEEFDETAGGMVTVAYKHVMEIMPTSFTGGTVAPNAAQAASGDYTCLSIKDYINNQLVREDDPLRFKSVDSGGVNRLRHAQIAMGKY